MKTTLAIIDAAMKDHPRSCIAFSGGADSMVLMDIVFRRTPYRPLVVFADSGMEYFCTLPFVRTVCEHYKAELHVARPTRTPQEQWSRQGWPMLGKLAARIWMQKHRGRGFGIRLDVSSCCRNMKIAPARRLAGKLGITLQFTGQRGGQDDILRGLRAIKDGAFHHVEADRMTICNPLLGWTDMMIRRYARKNGLPSHPARAMGAVTIGCVCCGGGSQFTVSAYRILRRVWPEAWWRYIVDMGMGEVILAIKYDRPLSIVRQAIELYGGLELIARTSPWVFDFTSRSPLPGYEKG
jgi:3'-phosphoadenosine 5'-phosphosulfate sulfotransferase (PAPS reductase)/FAD synthetase